MFWGLVLEPGKRYSTTVDKSFHVSMAALDCSSIKSGSEIISIILESDGQENILCNLSKQHVMQCHLDLNFMTGDKVAFEVKGNGIVHLSGYLVLDEEDEDFSGLPEYDEDDDDEEEEPAESVKEKAKGKEKSKRKSTEVAIVKGGKNKKIKLDAIEDDSDEDDEDDEEDEDEDLAVAEESSEEEDEEDDNESGEEDDDSEDEEDDVSEEEEVPVVKAKQKTPQSNKKQQTPVNKQPLSANKQNSTPSVNGSSPGQTPLNKKNKKKGNQDTPKTTPSDKKVIEKLNESASPQRKKLEGGVLIKDLKEGSGPIAKNGMTVSVYYQGRLRNNNKMFDECKRGGPAFKFRLGKGEVIKGWDVGVSGMKVGGIRTITCPPNMAYGQKGAPPNIPPNSPLVFQVELKAVN